MKNPLSLAWVYEILRLRLAAPNSKLSRMTINATLCVAFHARKAHFTHTEYAITKPQVSFHSRRGRVSLPETQGFVPHNVVERYDPNGARYVLTNAIFCLRQSDMPLLGRGLKHLIHRKRSPFPSMGRQGVGAAHTTNVVKTIIRHRLCGFSISPLQFKHRANCPHTTNVVCVPHAPLF